MARKNQYQGTNQGRDITGWYEIAIKLDGDGNWYQIRNWLNHFAKEDWIYDVKWVGFESKISVLIKDQQIAVLFKLCH